MVFIGRQEECRRFYKSIRALLGRTPRYPVYRVYLIRGEGGFGKTTLLMEYQRCAQKHEIPCVYLDCASEEISSAHGTPFLMRVLMDRLQKIDDRLREGSFEKVWRDRESDSSQFFQVLCSRAFVEDVQSFLEQRPLVILLDTWEKVQEFASQWLLKGLIPQILTSPHGERALFVVAGRLTDDFIKMARDRLHEFRAAIYQRSLEAFTQKEMEEYLRRYNLKVDPKQCYHLTRGIPLALDLLRVVLQGAVLQEGGGSASAQPPGSHAEIIRGMTERFLRYLRDQQERENDRRSLYGLALIGYLPCAEAFKESLLMQWWARERPGHDPLKRLNQLRQEFSFVEVGRIGLHADVQAFLVRYLQTEDRTYAVGLARGALNALDEMPPTKKESADRMLTRFSLLLWAREFEAAMRAGLDLLHHRSFRALRPKLLNFLQEWEADVRNWSNTPQDFVELIRTVNEWGSGDAAYRFAQLAERYGARQVFTRQVFIGILGQARAAAERRQWEEVQRILDRLERLALRGTPEWAPEDLEKIASGFYKIVRETEQRPDWQAQERWRAIRIGEKLIGEHPLLLLAKARCCIRLRMFPEACHALAKARIQMRLRMRMDAESWGAESCRRWLQHEVERMPSPKRARMRTRMGDIWSAYGEFSLAMDCYVQAIEDDSNYVPALLRLSHLQRQLGQFQEAHQSLEEAHQRLARAAPPPHWQARWEEAMGDLYAAQRKYNEAIRHLEKAIRISPDYVNPRIGLAWVHLRRSNPDEAKQHLNDALQILEQGPKQRGPLYQAYNGLGMATLLQDSARINEAQQYFHAADEFCEAISRKKRTLLYQIVAHRGLAAVGLGEIEGALQYFKQLESFFHPKWFPHGWLRSLEQDVNLLKAVLRQPEIGRVEGLLQSMLRL